ncbi:hypothetical protein Hypma_010409 [Hypsizygus marmoreus]|uniref:Uncharacterized protein n=1 Tax=Hypsizygus marmoreus TaxID=39966 RepID=A0A369JST3_HYPMA|nr:hypothetical protein Hypma_010409 [Hypsizygus marmoreus]
MYDEKDEAVHPLPSNFSPTRSRLCTTSVNSNPPTATTPAQPANSTTYASSQPIVDRAVEQFNTLRDVVDPRSPTSLLTSITLVLVQLPFSTALVRWSPFMYFDHPHGRRRTLLLKTFLSPTYLNTIQRSCPLIIWYLSTAPSPPGSTEGTAAGVDVGAHSDTRLSRIFRWMCTGARTELSSS